MDKNLKKLLSDISLEEANDDLGVERDLLKNIRLNKSLILTVQGVRRSGKSIFIKQIINLFFDIVKKFF